MINTLPSQTIRHKIECKWKFRKKEQEVRIRASCGYIYITLAYKKKKLHNVFIVKGTSGTCERVHFSVLGKNIAKRIELGDTVNKIAKDMIGNNCGELRFTWTDNKGKIHNCCSCLDWIGHVIRDRQEWIEVE